MSKELLVMQTFEFLLLLLIDGGVFLRPFSAYNNEKF